MKRHRKLVTMVLIRNIVLCISLLIRSTSGFTIQQPAVNPPSSALYSATDDSLSSTPLDRRHLLQGLASSAMALTITSTNPTTASAEATSDKILVLGGSGFVGTQVCNQLHAKNIPFVSTSTNGRDGTIALDFTSGINIGATVKDIIKSNDITAVISTIGAIGTDDVVKTINSGTGLAAIGAKEAGVSKFVYISVAPEVKDSVKGISLLSNYMDGKAFSEDCIVKNFGSSSYTLIEPTFIYGGDSYGLNPPRVADGPYGRFIEGLLSSSPLRAAASISPGIIGVALEPPIKVGSVAGAAVSSALGLSQEAVLDTYDEINAAAGLL